MGFQERCSKIGVALGFVLGSVSLDGTFFEEMPIVSSWPDVSLEGLAGEISDIRSADVSGSGMIRSIVEVLCLDKGLGAVAPGRVIPNASAADWDSEGSRGESLHNSLLFLFPLPFPMCWALLRLGQDKCVSTRGSR